MWKTFSPIQWSTDFVSFQVWTCAHHSWKPWCIIICSGSPTNGVCVWKSSKSSSCEPAVNECTSPSYLIGFPGFFPVKLAWKFLSVDFNRKGWLNVVPAMQCAKQLALLFFRCAESRIEKNATSMFLIFPSPRPKKQLCSNHTLAWKKSISFLHPHKWPVRKGKNIASNLHLDNNVLEWENNDLYCASFCENWK